MCHRRPPVRPAIAAALRLLVLLLLAGALLQPLGCRRIAQRRAASSETPVAAAAIPGRHSAGYRVVHVPVGSGSIDVAVWYPTDAAERETTYGRSGLPGRVARDAAPVAGSLPLLVFSHGYSGGGIGSASITEAIARRGWVVAAPDHSDEVMAVRIEDEPSGNLREALRNLGGEPPSTETHAYRMAEIRAVIDSMLRQSTLQIAPKHLALAGHSMGGWTVVNAVLEGAPASALVLYSVGELQWMFKGERFFEADQLARLHLPVMYFYGGDEVRAARAKGRDGVYATWAFEHTSPPAYLLMIPGGNHFLYNVRKVAPRSGGTPEQFRQVVEATVAFLERHVLGRTVAIPADRRK